MQSELVIDEQASLADAPSRATPLAKVTAILFWIFFAITTLAVFIPFNPSMPSRGIDPSYAFALNQAVARHLSFGKDIIFTYGPYPAIGTGMYDPATDRATMLGWMFLTVSYATAVLFLARGQKRFLTVILLLFFATFANGELLLLSYPFLLVLCVLKQADQDGPENGVFLNRRRLTATAVMWLTLGLLPVVKGTLLVPFAACLGLTFALLVYRRRFGYAVFSLLIPIATSLALWLVAGQSLRNIPAFLLGTLALTSGFTDAMALPWSVVPAILGDGLVLLFLVVSGMTLFSVSRTTRLTAASKWTLSLICAPFLLVAFKHGFVGTATMWTAFASLAAFTLLIGLLYLDKILVWSLSAAILMTAATSIMRDPVLVDQVHQRFGIGAAWAGGQRRADILKFCLDRALQAYPRTTYKKTWSTYVNAWNGFVSRAIPGNSLENQFLAAEANIRRGYALPVLKGSSDFYEYDQSILLASGNTWNPRPVLQGYTAYTPALASLDEQHIRGQHAPDWIFFDLQTIDGRLPSLDDGLSWPALLDNYTYVSDNGQFVVLRKNQVLHATSRYDAISTNTYKVGSTVALPQTDGLCFAQVDINPTLAGRMLTTLLNPPQLHMTLGLADGTTKTFRIVSNMTKTDFLLSPLVSTTKSFAAMMAESKLPQGEGTVRSISISPTYGGPLYWSSTYQLTLKRYVADLPGAQN